jgi:hypothetical protein
MRGAGISRSNNHQWHKGAFCSEIDTHDAGSCPHSRHFGVYQIHSFIIFWVSGFRPQPPPPPMNELLHGCRQVKHLSRRREKKSEDKEIRRGIVSKCAFCHAHFDQRLDAPSKTIFSTWKKAISCAGQV